ncbi:MAG: glycosyltransferase family 2 protein [Opitutaceae bacterium]|nr:glycosyltransferase family 2 protein [Opitutaceae bacterium]
MSDTSQPPGAVQKKPRIGVVVVTHRPAGGLEGRLSRMSAQGDAMVVVDNASGPEARVSLEETCTRHGWELIANPENRGIGVALNQGVARLAEKEFEWVILFDQDSKPEPGMSGRMAASLQSHPKSDRVGVVGAAFQERATARQHRFLRPHPLFPCLFQKIEPMGKDLLGVTSVITSGSLVRVAAMENAGRFDEAFFIDYVDTDFCLRCRRQGWLTMVSAAAHFTHELGRRERRWWGGMEMEPTHHSPVRHYYMARNRIAMWRRHAAAVPHWALYDFCFALYNYFRVAVFETGRWRKFRAVCLGTWDGLRGRSGPCPESRQRALLEGHAPS